MKGHGIVRRGLVLLMAMVLVCGSFPAAAFAARKPSLSAKRITIARGMKYKLKVKNRNSSVKWTSSNKKVAKVSKSGKVTGVKDGKATIKATVKSGGKKKVLKCKVTVKTPKFSKKKYTVSKGSKLTLKLKNKYKGSSYKWKSSDKSIVKVSKKGVVTGVSKGTATVSAVITIPKKGARLKKKLTVKTKVRVAAKSIGDMDEQEVSYTDTGIFGPGPRAELGASPIVLNKADAPAEPVSGEWKFVRCEWDEDAIKVKKIDDTCSKAFLVSEAGTKWNSGWYVLDSNVTVDERIEISGDVNLILADGMTLYADRGIKIGNASSLSIYGQSTRYDECGKIIANRNKQSGVGIGTATAGDTGGSLYIHGGNITANGGKNDAGIGSGDKKDCIDIYVYHGKIKAEGGTSAAGIGDGRGVNNSGNINLYGGTVDAYGGHYAAGIGGGDRVDGKGGHHSKTISIYNCKVHAYGGDDGAGIGGGEGGHCGTIIICGQSKAQYEVFAYGGNNGAGIGNGECESTGDGGSIWILDESYVDATGGGDGAGIGGGENGRADYIEIEGGIVKAYGGENSAGIGGGSDADGSGKEIKITDGIIVAYGHDGAGIGGGEGGDGRTITIDGGQVYAYGGGEKRFTGTGNGAGIGGGGHGGDGGTITINDGIVHGESVYGAGIGGGRAKEANDRSGKGGNITINDGEVTATALTFGIGCGSSEEDEIDLHRLTMNSMGHFIMNGGTVKAYGKAAGVGARNGIFDMKGGTLTADGRGKGAGIWFTYDRDDHDIAHINFTGGTTYAQGYKDGGIMTGSDAEEGNFNEIKISGKNTYVYVSCTGSEAGIGGRRMGPTVKIEDGATVNVKTKSGWAKSIGGHAGLYKTGTCKVYDEAQVILANRSDTPVPKDERSDACHYKDNSYDLWVKPCDHPGQDEYTVTKDGERHKRKCKYCKTSFPEEVHKYNKPEDKICTVCGNEYKAAPCNITIDAGEGSGSAEKISVAKNYEYTLPECTYTPPSQPEGAVFYRWEVRIGENGERNELKPETSVIISDNTTVKALWSIPYKVTFKPGFGEPFTEEVLYGDMAEEPDSPEQEGFAFEYWRLEDGSADTPYNFAATPVTGDITLVAEWSDKPVTIKTLGCDQDKLSGKVSAGVGSVHVSPGDVVAAGTRVTLTATIDKEQKNIYEFYGWYKYTSKPEQGPFVTLTDKLADASEGMTYTFLTSDSYPEIQIAAVYRKKSSGFTLLRLDQTMVSGGVVSVKDNMMRVFDDGTVGYVLNTDEPVTLEVSPNAGYWAERIYYTFDYYYPGDDLPTKRGLEVEPDMFGNYTFTPPAANAVLHADFDNQEYSLDVYSADTGCMGPAGAVKVISAKDAYRVNDQVTVQAEEAEGYDFVGWYPVTELTDGEVTAYNQDSILSDKLTYTFNFGKGNVDLVAVYKVHDGNALVKVVPLNGAEYTASGQIDKSAADPDALYDHARIFTVPVGQSISLTAHDADSVLHWRNESQKILGSGAGLDHYVTSSTTIYLVYSAANIKSVYLQFISDYDQVLSYQQIRHQSDIEFPVILTRVGRTFEKWVFEGTDEEATQASIWAMAESQKLITVRPKFIKDENMAQVTVNYMTEDTVHHTEEKDVMIGDGLNLKAPDIDGYQFSCWKDEDGSILGYTKDYFIQVSSDRKLNACYEPEGSAVEEVKPTITLSSLIAVEAGEVHKVRGVATRSIPDEYTLIEQGVLYAFDNELPEEEFIYTDGSNGVIRFISTSRDKNGVVGLNARVDTDDQVVSMRGYMLLRDETGEEEYYYTKKLDGSYNTLS